MIIFPFSSSLPILTLYIGAQITLTKVGRTLIVEERRLQLSCHAHSVLIRIWLARATFGVPVALCVATLEQARHIGDCHIAIGTNSADSSAIATVGLLVACSLQHHHRLTVAQIRLIHQYCLAELMLQHSAHNMKIRCRFPAGLQLAAARHAVALATELHVVGDGL